MGGHFTSPYEQKTQQYFLFGFNKDLHEYLRKIQKGEWG
jgi:hypothetical protein